ncbi:MAG: hypothetical protein IH984_15655 [Planctomycetes bacterium]|nr:hypothetical protein [Planctomycetota bacterium]
MNSRRDNQHVDKARDEKLPLGPRQKFLSVMYRCCNVYGRMYANDEKTQYTGRCPKCGRSVHALIGSEGTDNRMFEAM